jgi:histidine ammonia-lyase
MSNVHWIDHEQLDLTHVRHILNPWIQLGLTKDTEQKIQHCRTYLEEKLQSSKEPFYGINTGFGSLCNVPISKSEVEQLQANLVQSHACGSGEEVPPEVVRLMLFLKIQNLSYGFSGVRLHTVQRLIELFNNQIYPIVYQQGSLGASGDLAPLAHLALPLIGLGQVYYQGKKRLAADVLEELNMEPLTLGAKEGLALLNGTQFSTAYGLYNLLEAHKLLAVSHWCAALSIDAFDCRLSPFDERLHVIRAHTGQVRSAARIRHLLKGSPIAGFTKQSVQDPYAFRCVPQVHGASWDTIDFVRQALLTELNSITDNPNIFPDSDAILSGGNFHAQPVALPLDFLAIALAELGSISERRTYQLISGQRNLPPFLVANPGLNSGLMIPQYTAASIVSQTKQLCTPASVDSIVSSNGQEDHVSMAANAATKLHRVTQNVERVLAIEFMTAAQALEFRRPMRTSETLETLVEAYRLIVPKLENDRILQHDMDKTVLFLRDQLEQMPTAEFL